MAVFTFDFPIESQRVGGITYAVDDTQVDVVGTALNALGIVADVSLDN